MALIWKHEKWIEEEILIDTNVRIDGALSCSTMPSGIPANAGSNTLRLDSVNGLVGVGNVDLRSSTNPFSGSTMLCDETQASLSSNDPVNGSASLTAGSGQFNATCDGYGSFISNLGGFLFSGSGSTFVIDSTSVTWTLASGLGYAMHDDTGFYLTATQTVIGDGTNNTVIEADGTLRFDGDATVWNDAFVDGLSLTGGATDPPVFAAFMGTIYGVRFDDGATKSSHGTIEIPHDYKEGTALELHVHWSPTTANTGNIRWGVEWTVSGINGTFGAATTSYITQAGAGIVSHHQAVTIVTIPGTGRKISDVVCFRVFRDGANAADTFTGNAFLHRIAIHYICDTVGSRLTTTK
jgi:hypothetical protein